MTPRTQENTRESAAATRRPRLFRAATGRATLVHVYERCTAHARRLGLALVLASLAAALLSGCPPGDDASLPDGGESPDAMRSDASASTAQLAIDVRLQIDGELYDGSDAAELGAGLRLERLALALAELRAPSDRGSDVRLRAPVALELVRGVRGVTFEEVPPAVYGAVTLRFDGDAAFDATLTRESESIHVVLRGPLTIDAVCPEGLALDPWTTGHVDVAIDASELAELLARGPLPPASSGVIEVDERRAPEFVRALARALMEGARAACERDAESAGARERLHATDEPR